MLIGLISDTHGLMRPEALRALDCVDMILHAGDVGGVRVLDQLRTIAPVRAVSGNTDILDAPELVAELDLVLDGVSVHVSHGHELGAPTPIGLVEHYDADVIVYGHTHQQMVAHVDGRLVVNPGAAGPRRFKLEPSVARLTIARGAAQVEVVPIEG